MVMVLCCMQMGTFIEENGLMVKRKEEVCKYIRNWEYNIKANGKMINHLEMENCFNRMVHFILETLKVELSMEGVYFTITKRNNSITNTTQMGL